MQAASFPAQPARAHHRFAPRTLTYVTLDEGNGGIIRNFNRTGVAVQAVAPLRLQQRVRVRFELRFPRLRVEVCGEVSWASTSGQCGIRFVDLPAGAGDQIDEWIFSNLLESAVYVADRSRSVFGASSGAQVVSISPEEHDGLTLSPAPRPAIRLEREFSRREQSMLNQSTPRQRVLDRASEEEMAGLADHDRADHDRADHDRAEHDPANHDLADHDLPGYAYAQSWLSQPLSGRALAWMVDGLIVIAGLLLFALIFLSIAHELPPWPLGTASAAAVLVAAAYWILFAVFGGSSLGARLARATSRFGEREESESVGRFR